jgi:hypothetical protein
MDKAMDQLSQWISMWKIGRCIPSSCTKEDVHIGFNAAIEAALPDSGLKISPDTCFSETDKIELDTADWAVIVLLVTFCLLVCTGTIIELGQNLLSYSSLSTTWCQNLLNFSAYSNAIKIFSTSQNHGDVISCINGIRFLSFIWVLVAHGYSFFCQGVPLRNLLYLADAHGPLFNSPAFQVVLNSFPSVDSFFFIGATLLAYLVLKELDKSKGGSFQFWIIYYVHRYIRLTGVYAIVIGITATLIKFFTPGPNSMLFLAETSNCKRDWWTNILYINNLH